jgi:hypothetical protein
MDRDLGREEGKGVPEDSKIFMFFTSPNCFMCSYSTSMLTWRGRWLR